MIDASLADFLFGGGEPVEAPAEIRKRLMTVDELRKSLAEFPPHLPVVFEDTEGVYWHIKEVQVSDASDFAVAAKGNDGGDVGLGAIVLTALD